MKLTGRIKPISYLKARAAEVIRGLCESGEAFVITVHGEAKAVLQDVARYEEREETLALLKILALSSESLAKGKARPAPAAFARVRDRVKF